MELIVTTEGKRIVRNGILMIGADMKGFYHLKSFITLVKDKTQRLERTNGIVRQQTGRWHRRQNKFGKVWEQSKLTARLVVSYFNWIWKHSRLPTTAAPKSKFNYRALDLERFSNLFHNNLMHNL